MNQKPTALNSLDPNVKRGDTLLFFHPETNSAVALARWDEERSAYLAAPDKQSLAQLQADRPGMVLATKEDVIRVTYASFLDDTPQPIAEAEFYRAMGAVPPLKRHCEADAETFFMGEGYAYDIHWAYVQFMGSHFRMRRPISETHASLVQRALLHIVRDNPSAPVATEEGSPAP